jgi:hypothetical protein
MSLKITGTAMTSTQTRHTARAPDGGGWELSWLPGRILTQSQAVTAMTIAEVAATHDLTNNADPMWPHIDEWAAELGMSGPAAVARVAQEGYRATWGEDW